MTCAVEALTLITWLRQYLSGLSVVNSLCFFPSHTVRFGKESLHAAYPWRLRGYAPSRRVEWLRGLFDILHRLISSPLFVYISMDLWAFILYFRLNPVPPYLLFCSDRSILGCGELFPLAPLSLLHTPVIMGFGFFFSSFLSTSLLSGSISCSRLTFYVFWPRRSHFSKESWFILLGNGFRNEDLGVRRVLCCWGVVVCSSP